MQQVFERLDRSLGFVRREKSAADPPPEQPQQTWPEWAAEKYEQGKGWLQEHWPRTSLRHDEQFMLGSASAALAYMLMNQLGKLLRPWQQKRQRSRVIDELLRDMQYKQASSAQRVRMMLDELQGKE